MTNPHDTIAAAILATVPGARPDQTRVTVEHAYAPYGHSIRDTWSGSLAGLMDRIDAELEKTTPDAGAEVTAAVAVARTVVLSALARALREQPTGARILQGLDELGEALVCEDPTEIRSWVDGISLLAGLPTTADPGVTVYRAAHGSIAVGLYSTEDAARRHCEALLFTEHADESALIFDWIGDDEDLEEPRELVVQLGDKDEQPTGYVVQALRVDPYFDPDAEW
ncbi:hypothetical protein [Streptomyces sp. NPDC086838]|uniref:hypothetical protein n=1 Tax=Streptomyces sp. NPDC086838 TaxID=3365762 RepID=UPI00381D14AE